MVLKIYYLVLCIIQSTRGASLGPLTQDQLNLVRTTKFFSFDLELQSSLSIATIEGSSEKRSHKTGGR